MAKHIGVDTSVVGKGMASVEESAWRKYRREKMIAMGIHTHFYDIHNENDNIIKISNRRPFTSQYETRDDYLDDRDKCLDYLLNNKYIPEELFNKVADATKEAGLVEEQQY